MPSPMSVAHPAPERRLTADREASTPTGRALHWLEDRVADLSSWTCALLAAHERETLLDAELDGKVRTAIAHLDGGNGLEARALLLEFLERDQLRDAEHRAQHGHVIGIQRVARRIGSFVERSFLAMRGGTR